MTIEITGPTQQHGSPGHTVALTDGTLEIDGQARVILCASLFPFRIPVEQWEARIQAVRALGYHCLDVYVPWNHHEVHPGQYDFTGPKDLSAFLDLAAKHELMVLVRPGPYICSEFDGGALPARLSTIPGLRVRQFESRYLTEVAGWFDAVMPIVASHQWTEGGPVILVQLENELDFHACDEPTEYVAALREMARGHQIDVPLIACSGQGDVYRSGGTVDGVAPAVNLYPDDDSLDVALVTRRYVDHLRSQGIPPLVTETNRLHRTLKRLLGSGIIFLGPYLQASGWNFDDDGATNNWGAPLGLMTSDYDFGGSIAPNGTEREDAHRGRLLRGFIDALGERLAGAAPQGPVTVQDGVEEVHLALRHGGTLSTVTNLSPSTRTLGIPAGMVQLASGETRLTVNNLPLGPSIRLATTGELFTLADREEELVIVVQAPGEQSVRISGIPGYRLESAAGDRTFSTTQEADAFVGVGRHGTAEIVLPDGRFLRITLLEAGAAGAIGAPPTAQPPFRRLITDDQLRLSTDLDVASTDLGDYDTPLPWEDLSRDRGFGSYYATLPADGHHQMLLSGAADVVSLHSSDRHTPHVAVGGQDIVLPWPSTGSEEVVEVRTLTWGHSNFDDARLPSLGLSSKRGLSGAAILGASRDIGGGWSVFSPEQNAHIGNNPAPIADFGGWSTSVRPLLLGYVREIHIPVGNNVAVLTLEDIRTPVEVLLDDKPVGSVTPLTPTLDLGILATPGTHRLELRVNLRGDDTAGRPKLATGNRITGWTMKHTGPAELGSAVHAARQGTETATLPLHVPPGQRRWILLNLTAHLPYFDEEDILLRMDGTGLFIRAFINGRGVGRLWTSPPNNAVMKGGRGDIALIPAPWAPAEPTVALLLEATNPSGGTLNALTLSNEIDLETGR